MEQSYSMVIKKKHYLWGKKLNHPERERDYDNILANKKKKRNGKRHLLEPTSYNVCELFLQSRDPDRK